MPTCPNGSFIYTVKPGDTLWLIAHSYNTTIEAIMAMNPGLNINMLYVGQGICVRPGTQNMLGFNMQYQNPGGISKAHLDLNNLMRLLWADHGQWTRETINSLAMNLPDVNPVINRLLRNPKDFANALRPLYGTKTADTFDKLLTEHLTLAADIVKATMAGDNVTATKSERLWYKNVDDIAELLGSINPYWSVNSWKNMLYEHLGLVKEEAVAIINKRYANGVAVYDRIEPQAMGMANELTRGIVRQFPQMFA